MKVFLLLAVLVLSGAAFADEQQVPKLIGRVNDYAGVLTVDESQGLESMLAAHEKATTNQVVILTMPTIGDTDIFSFSHAVFYSWKLGQEDKDNGVLIVMVKDRLQKGEPTRIHTGRGLEGALPDVICTRIVVEQMKPLLLQGKYAEGLRVGASSVIVKIGQEYAPATKSEPQSDIWVPAIVLVCVFFAIVGILMWSADYRREKRRQEEAARETTIRQPRFHASYPDRSPAPEYPYTSSRATPRPSQSTQCRTTWSSSQSESPVYALPDPDPSHRSESPDWSRGSDPLSDFSGGGGESAGGGGGD